MSIINITSTENQISELCDQLIPHVPSNCARELIFQIRSLAGSGRVTSTGHLGGNGTLDNPKARGRYSAYICPICKKISKAGTQAEVEASGWTFNSRGSYCPDHRPGKVESIVTLEIESPRGKWVAFLPSYDGKRNAAGGYDYGYGPTKEEAVRNLFRIVMGGIA